MHRPGERDLARGEYAFLVQLQELAVVGGDVDRAAVGAVDDGIQVASGVEFAAAIGRDLDDLESGFAEVKALVLFTEQADGLAVRSGGGGQQPAGELFIQQGAVVEVDQVFLLVLRADQDFAPLGEKGEDLELAVVLVTQEHGLVETAEPVAALVVGPGLKGVLQVGEADQEMVFAAAESDVHFIGRGDVQRRPFSRSLATSELARQASATARYCCRALIGTADRLSRPLTWAQRSLAYV